MNSKLKRIWVVFVALVGATFFNSQAARADDKEDNEMMAALAGEAVVYAKDTFGITLDYSAKSIKSVDTMIDQISKKSPSNDNIKKYSIVFGAYVAEVIKRTLGGEWKSQTTLSGGSNKLTFHLGTIQMWPNEKVEKRFINGPEDSLSSYYDILSMHTKGKLDL